LNVYVAAVILVVAVTPSIVVASGDLLLFGGPGHRVFLGCFGCSKYHPNSVYNQYGLYGNSYGVNSIWNSYGLYGSPYSVWSACNPNAIDPPVVVDEDGVFYGRLTLNLYHPQAIRESGVVNWLRFAVCKG
jgi:hypothetical protein